jgi:uncharacterized protein CbrC (UPF0167 family)
VDTIRPFVGVHVGHALNNEIQERYDAAEMCRHNAQQAIDPQAKDSYLVLVQRWLGHAYGYEFSCFSRLKPGDLTTQPCHLRSNERRSTRRARM